jgi:hypothetical protein
MGQPEKRKGEEGCLSVPGIYDGVERSLAVKVTALDGTASRRTIEAEGMLAVCIQHEMDHLLGKVFVEYLSPLKRNRIKSKLLKAEREERRMTALRVVFAGTPEFARGGAGAAARRGVRGAAGADPARPAGGPRHEAAGLARQAVRAGARHGGGAAAQPAAGRQVSRRGRPGARGLLKSRPDAWWWPPTG